MNFYLNIYKFTKQCNFVRERYEFVVWLKNGVDKIKKLMSINTKGNLYDINYIYIYIYRFT